MNHERIHRNREAVDVLRQDALNKSQNGEIVLKTAMLLKLFDLLDAAFQGKPITLKVTDE